MGLKPALKLWSSIHSRGLDTPTVVRLSDGTTPPISGREVLWLPAAAAEVPDSLFVATMAPVGHDSISSNPHIAVPDDLSYLGPGDIVQVDPIRERINVLYRRSSPFNSILVTERCNSYCLMCSQPPKLADDSSLVDEWLDAIPLMSPETVELGITGGEPTLLGARFFELLRAAVVHLPKTAVHVLSNGRLFAYLRQAQELARVNHPDLMVGIPLYADVPWTHDFVVQAEGAFDQTIRGMLNLARVGQRVEIRVVIHQQTYRRLPELGRFIARNLPFVEHVALMGLEPIGHVKMNLGALWVDPLDYQAELSACVEELECAGMNVSIYNHQLCVLPESLWRFCRKSISDWKNVYLPACSGCQLQEQCGGFFAWAAEVHSRGISPQVFPTTCATVRAL